MASSNISCSKNNVPLWLYTLLLNASGVLSSAIKGCLETFQCLWGIIVLHIVFTEEIV